MSEYNEIDVLFEMAISAVLDSEIKILEDEINKLNNPFFSFSIYNQAYRVKDEICALNSRDELRDYLTKGGTITKSEVNNYISGLLFTYRNQIN